MYGPVNVDSYYFVRLKLYSNEQESNDDTLLELKEDIKNGTFNEYEHIIKNLKDIDSQELVFYSHHNLEYKNARKDLDEFEPCKNKLDENNPNFIDFDEKVKSKVSKFFS